MIVPITKGPGSGPDHDAVTAQVNTMVAACKSHKIRVKVDDRMNVRPGAKYFEWERKGVPIRLEIGPRDITNNAAQMAVRHSGDSGRSDSSSSGGSSNSSSSSSSTHALTPHIRYLS